MRTPIVFAEILLVVLLFGADSQAAAANDAQDECQSDSECVAMTALKQSCRHVDPKAKDVCPAVNRKYAQEIELVSCYTNSGCRPITNISCRRGRCVGDEESTPKGQ